MEWIAAHWPAPSWVRAYTSTRLDGVSPPPYESLNLAHHVGDHSNNVTLNRLKCRQHFNWVHEPLWLNQTHSNHIHLAEQVVHPLIDADGSITQIPNLPCVVLTADCLPLIICDTKGTIVAAIHCGWRGIYKRIIEHTLQSIRQYTKEPLLAWLGPCIGAQHYEVGEELYEQFVNLHPRHQNAFAKGVANGKFLLNLTQVAENILQMNGVLNIYFSNECTFSNELAFYSYRRKAISGRSATFIWLEL